MSRGWESKDVEGQIAEAQARHRGPIRNIRSADELAAEQKLEGLLMNQTRLQNEMLAAQNPRYRAMLEASIADLDLKIAEAKRTSSPSENSA